MQGAAVIEIFYVLTESLTKTHCDIRPKLRMSNKSRNSSASWQ